MTDEDKTKLADEAKAVGTEAKAAGGRLLAWIEGHPAVALGFFAGLAIGWIFGRLMG